ncbi:hypothetical protein AAMO2058_000022300 [Amorphochlora amoebiformis]
MDKEVKEGSGVSGELERLVEALHKLRNVDAYDDPEQPLLVESKKAKGVAPTPPCSLRIRRQLRGHQGKVYAMDWGAADGNCLVSAAADGKVIVWNAFLQTKVHAIPLRSNWVMTCAFAPSQALVASGGLDNTCAIWTIPEGLGEYSKQSPHSELQKHDGYLSCCKFVDNSRILTGSGDKTCILWDIEKRAPLTVFKEHDSDVGCIDVHSNGTFISGSVDKMVMLYDYRKGSRVMSFPGHLADVNDVAYFPNGDSFATASEDGSCRMWDIRAGRQIQRFYSDRNESPATCLSFSKTGTILFAGYDNNALVGWDTRRSSIAQVMQGHDKRPSCMGIHPKGHALCTGSWDGLLRIWAK